MLPLPILLSAFALCVLRVTANQQQVSAPLAHLVDGIIHGNNDIEAEIVISFDKVDVVLTGNDEAVRMCTERSHSMVNHAATSDPASNELVAYYSSNNTRLSCKGTVRTIGINGVETLQQASISCEAANNGTGKRSLSNAGKWQHTPILLSYGSKNRQSIGKDPLVGTKYVAGRALVSESAGGMTLCLLPSNDAKLGVLCFDTLTPNPDETNGKTLVSAVRGQLLLNSWEPIALLALSGNTGCMLARNGTATQEMYVRCADMYRDVNDDEAATLVPLGTYPMVQVQSAAVDGEIDLSPPNIPSIPAATIAARSLVPLSSLQDDQRFAVKSHLPRAAVPSTAVSWLLLFNGTSVDPGICLENGDGLQFFPLTKPQAIWQADGTTALTTGFIPFGLPQDGLYRICNRVNPTTAYVGGAAAHIMMNSTVDFQMYWTAANDAVTTFPGAPDAWYPAAPSVVVVANDAWSGALSMDLLQCTAGVATYGVSSTPSILQVPTIKKTQTNSRIINVALHSLYIVAQFGSSFHLQVTCTFTNATTTAVSQPISRQTSIRVKVASLSLLWQRAFSTMTLPGSVSNVPDASFVTQPIYPAPALVVQPSLIAFLPLLSLVQVTCDLSVSGNVVLQGSRTSFMNGAGLVQFPSVGLYGEPGTVFTATARCTTSWNVTLLASSTGAIAYMGLDWDGRVDDNPPAYFYAGYRLDDLPARAYLVDPTNSLPPKWFDYAYVSPSDMECFITYAQYYNRTMRRVVSPQAEQITPPLVFDPSDGTIAVPGPILTPYTVGHVTERGVLQFPLVVQAILGCMFRGQPVGWIEADMESHNISLAFSTAPPSEIFSRVGNTEIGGTSFAVYAIQTSFPGTVMSPVRVPITGSCILGLELVQYLSLENGIPATGLSVVNQREYRPLQDGLCDWMADSWWISGPPGCTYNLVVTCEYGYMQKISLGHRISSFRPVVSWAASTFIDTTTGELAVMDLTASPYVRPQQGVYGSTWGDIPYAGYSSPAAFAAGQLGYQTKNISTWRTQTTANNTPQLWGMTHFMLGVVEWKGANSYGYESRPPSATLNGAADVSCFVRTYTYIAAPTSRRTTSQDPVNCPEFAGRPDLLGTLPPYYLDEAERQLQTGGLAVDDVIATMTSVDSDYRNSTLYRRWICTLDGSRASFAFVTWSDARTFRLPTLAGSVRKIPPYFVPPGITLSSYFGDEAGQLFSIEVVVRDTEYISPLLKVAARGWMTCNMYVEKTYPPLRRGVVRLSSTTVHVSQTLPSSSEAASSMYLDGIFLSFSASVLLQQSCQLAVATNPVGNAYAISGSALITGMDFSLQVKGFSGLAEPPTLNPFEEIFQVLGIPTISTVNVTHIVTAYHGMRVNATYQMHLGHPDAPLTAADDFAARNKNITWSYSALDLSLTSAVGCYPCYADYRPSLVSSLRCMPTFPVRPYQNGDLEVTITFTQDAITNVTLVAMHCFVGDQTYPASPWKVSGAFLVHVRRPTVRFTGSGLFHAYPSAPTSLRRLDEPLILAVIDPHSGDTIRHIDQCFCSLAVVDVGRSMRPVGIGYDAQILGLPVEGVLVTNGYADFRGIGIIAAPGSMVQIEAACIYTGEFSNNMRAVVNVTIASIVVYGIEELPAAILYNTPYTISVAANVTMEVRAVQPLWMQFDARAHGQLTCQLAFEAVDQDITDFFPMNVDSLNSLRPTGTLSLTFRVSASVDTELLIVAMCDWNNQIVRSVLGQSRIAALHVELQNALALPSVVLPSSAGAFIALVPAPLLKVPHALDPDMLSMRCSVRATTDEQRCEAAVRIREPVTYGYNHNKQAFVMDNVYVAGYFGCKVRLIFSCLRLAGDWTIPDVLDIRIAAVAALLTQAPNQIVALGQELVMTITTIDKDDGAERTLIEDSYTACSVQVLNATVQNGVGLADQGSISFRSLNVFGQLGRTYNITLHCTLGEHVVPSVDNLPVTFRGCSEGQQPTADGRSCTKCVGQSFSLQDFDSCLPCPGIGAICRAGLVDILPGYFPVSMHVDGRVELGALNSQHSTIFACPDLQACIVNSTTREVSCAAGRTGPLCGVCILEQNYFPNGHVCSKCRPAAMNAFILLVLLLLILVWVIYHTFFSKFQGRPMSGVIWRIGMTYVSSLAALRTYAASGTQIFQDAVMAVQSAVLPMMASSGEAVGPLACLLHFSFLDRLYTAMLMPLTIAALSLLLLLLFRVARMGKARCDWFAVKEIGASVSTYLMSGKPLAILLLAVFLCYTSVLSAALSTLPCSPDIAGRSYMVHAFDIDCDSRERQTAATISWIVIALLAVACPVGLIAILKKNGKSVKSSNEDTKFFSAFGFLFSGYRTRDTNWAFTWEALVLLRRAGIMLLPYILDDVYMQSGAFVILLTAFIVAHVTMLPYVSALHNIIEACCLLSLLISQCLAMIYYRAQELKRLDAEYLSNISNTVSTVAIFINGWMLLLLLIFYLRHKKEELTEKAPVQRLLSFLRVRTGASMKPGPVGAAVDTTIPEISNRNPMLRLEMLEESTSPASGRQPVSPWHGHQRSSAPKLQFRAVSRPSVAVPIGYAPLTTKGGRNQSVNRVVTRPSMIAMQRIQRGSVLSPAAIGSSPKSSFPTSPREHI